MHTNKPTNPATDSTKLDFDGEREELATTLPISINLALDLFLCPVRDEVGIQVRWKDGIELKRSDNNGHGAVSCKACNMQTTNRI